jgi:hypothetical protein
MDTPLRATIEALQAGGQEGPTGSQCSNDWGHESDEGG